MQTIKMSFLVVPCSAHYNIRANNLIVVELSLRSNIMVRTKFSRMRTFVLHTFIGNKKHSHQELGISYIGHIDRPDSER